MHGTNLQLASDIAGNSVKLQHCTAISEVDLHFEPISRKPHLHQDSSLLMRIDSISKADRLTHYWDK